MDISVTEFEGNEAIRQANFYDLAVTSESIHEVHTKTDPMDTVVYTVTSENGDVITNIVPIEK